MKKLSVITASVILVVSSIIAAISPATAAVESYTQVFLEAENMDISGHAIAEKTKTSVKASYTNGTGDDWLAHGGYVNYTINEDECLYVKARTLSAISDSSRQFSVRYTYRLGGAAPQEYFFHFAGDTFSTVDEYIDIPLYNPDLIGAVVSEIVLFGNAADRDPFEVDCFILGESPIPSETVLFEAENMNVIDIAVKTDSGVLANYSKDTENNYLCWGAYINQLVDSNAYDIILRAKTFYATTSDMVLKVGFFCSDQTVHYVDIGAEFFNSRSDFTDIVLPTDEINGKVINEIVVFGNLVDKVSVELDCFTMRKKRDAVLPENTVPTESCFVNAEKFTSLSDSLGADTVSYENRAIKLSPQAHMPTTLTQDNAVYLESGECVLRTGFLLEHKLFFRKADILKISVFETSVDRGGNETRRCIAKRIVSASEFENHIYIQKCFDISFTAKENCSYDAVICWEGNAELTFSGAVFAKSNLIYDPGRLYTMESSTGIFSLSELPADFSAADRMCFKNSDIKTTVSAPEMIHLLNNYDSVELKVGVAQQEQADALTEMVNKYNSINDVREFYDVSIIGTVDSKTSVAQLIGNLQTEIIIDKNSFVNGAGFYSQNKRNALCDAFPTETNDSLIIVSGLPLSGVLFSKDKPEEAAPKIYYYLNTIILSSDMILAEAENMDITGHTNASKTESSVKADYATEGGDDWIAHGGYVDKKIESYEQYFVRARAFAKSESLRQMTVKFVCTDGMAVTEHYFDFAGADFFITGQYIDLLLDTSKLVGLTLKEIVIFGNAVDCAPFEVDCFYIDETDRDDRVLFQAEDMNVVDIGRKTATSVVAEYAVSTENEWLIWGGYTNHIVNNTLEQITVRCRIFEHTENNRVLTVKLVCTDGNEYYYDIPSTAFNRVGSYIDYIISTDNINGKTISEIVAFGNLANATKVEVDCFNRRPVQIIADINGDGDVNIKDLIRLKKYFANIVSDMDIVFKNSDCNSDMLLDTFDMIAVRKYLLNN